MNLLIADDEPLARARLCELVAEIGGHTIVGEAANGREVLLKVSELAVDIVLMDIRMPGMDGLEAAMHLAILERPPMVIFTTAYSDYALAAFDAHALDYLLKPIRKERLADALQRAQSPLRIPLAKLRQTQSDGRTHISALMYGNLQLVAVSDIVYCKADQKYVTVRHLNGQVLIEDSLNALEAEFGARFIRIHRNALVAHAYIAGMVKNAEGGCSLKLRGTQETLEISRRHAAQLRQILKNYAEPRISE